MSILHERLARAKSALARAISAQSKPPSLAEIRRTGVDFGYARPDVEDSEPIVNSLARFLKREPTEPEKRAAIAGMIVGQRAKRSGKPNPNAPHRARLAVKSTHTRHGTELATLKAQHRSELESLRDKQRKAVERLRKTQRAQLARATGKRS